MKSNEVNPSIANIAQHRQQSISVRLVNEGTERARLITNDYID